MITNQILATYPFLSRLSAESRRLVDASAKTKSVAQGACLLRQGDRIHGLYLVLTGRLRVYTLSAAGDKASLYVIPPGESCPLAMNAMLTQKPHQAWVQAETKTVKLFFIPARVFRDLYEHEQAVREFALTVLSSHVSTLMTALEGMSLLSVGERLENHLRQCADERGEVVATHQEIALALGTAREVVSRKLRVLDRAGLIKTRRGRITVRAGLMGYTPRH